MSPGVGIREPQSRVCDEGPGQTSGELVSQQSVKETASDCLMKYRGACNFTNVFDIKKQLPVYTFTILISILIEILIFFYNFNFKTILAGFGQPVGFESFFCCPKHGDFALHPMCSALMSQTGLKKLHWVPDRDGVHSAAVSYSHHQRND